MWTWTLARQWFCRLLAFFFFKSWCTHWYRLYLNAVQYWEFFGCSDLSNLLWCFTFPCRQDCWSNIASSQWLTEIGFTSIILAYTVWAAMHYWFICLFIQQEHLGLPWLQCGRFAMARVCILVGFSSVTLFKVFCLVKYASALLRVSLFFHEGAILWSLLVSLSLCYSEFLVGVWHMLSSVNHTQNVRWVSDEVQSSFHRVCHVVLRRGVGAHLHIKINAQVY